MSDREPIHSDDCHLTFEQILELRDLIRLQRHSARELARLKRLIERREPGHER